MKDFFYYFLKFMQEFLIFFLKVYGILNPGSEYHKVFWTQGWFFRGSKYHMAPALF